jgi:nucleoside-diphosphate-sugar epimerase
MNIFIAGATGVYGRNLLPLLLERGHTVGALARTAAKADALRRAGVTPVLGDLLDAATQTRLPEVLRGYQAVLHLATAIPANGGAPGAWEANTALRTTGTRALLDAALAAGAERYVQQSIVMAYVDGGDRPLDEATPLATVAQRPAAGPVVEMEAMVRAAPADRLAWCILRGGSFVGPGTAQEALIQRVRDGAEVVPGDGLHYISPVHVADMASATLAAVERAPAGAIYNVADEPVRYGEYVDALAQLLRAPKPRRDPERPRPAACRADSSAIRLALGWTPLQGLFPPLG